MQEGMQAGRQASAEDPTESGGFGFDLCQAEQSPDYSQLVPGSHCTTLQDPAKAAWGWGELAGPPPKFGCMLRV